MDNFVITIARQYGSGGRTVGEMLAKKLGIVHFSPPYYTGQFSKSLLFSFLLETKKSPDRIIFP